MTRACPEAGERRVRTSASFRSGQGRRCSCRPSRRQTTFGGAPAAHQAAGLVLAKAGSASGWPEPGPRLEPDFEPEGTRTYQLDAGGRAASGPIMVATFVIKRRGPAGPRARLSTAAAPASPGGCQCGAHCQCPSRPAGVRARLIIGQRSTLGP